MQKRGRYKPVNATWKYCLISSTSNFSARAGARRKLFPEGRVLNHFFHGRRQGAYVAYRRQDAIFADLVIDDGPVVQVGSRRQQFPGGPNCNR